MLKRILFSLAMATVFVSNAQAASLGLTLLDTPDIVSSFIDVTYDASSDTLSASGFALQLDTPGGPDAIAGGGFSLNATVDGAGILAGGSITISGTIAALGYNSGTLLTGTLDAFGFPNAGGDPLEFLFTVTGGDAAALYGAAGGIILTGSAFGGDWNSDFDNLISGVPGTGQGLADVAAVVPIPGAIWLMLTALLSLGATRRR